jgi:soluble lytic murein transglycosylase-like protein
MIILLLAGQVMSYVQPGSVFLTNVSTLGSDHSSYQEQTIVSYDHIITHYCQIYGIDPELVKILIEKESQFNPRAVSRSGAMGLMQLMPETAARLGVDNPYDPRQNIEGGVRFLRDLFAMFGGDLELTLAAYHAGPGIVKRINRVPSIPETMDYVDYILSRYGGSPVKQIYFTLTDEGTPLFTNCPK